ncbi:MAG: PIN domain-containing protein [Calditrichaeota bacterium]|nr:PIN domain-containing protein [Calditrichota bacterium]
MIALIDTDVLIDVALNREPFAEDSARILDAAQRRKFQAVIAWHTIANFYYILSSPSGKLATKAFISDLLEFVDIAPTQTAQAKRALQLDLPDFEDALQVVAATSAGADFIVTRNLKHYQKSPVPAISPADFFQKLTAK